MKTLQCVVIDDEPLAIDILERYIARVPFLEMAGTFRSAVKALAFVRGAHIDLLFLDINMPDIDGIDFVNDLDYHAMVIFTTAYSRYAVASYDCGAVDYLMKPINFPRFLKAVGRALERAAANMRENGTDGGAAADDGILMVKSGSQYVRLNINEIQFIQAAGNYVNIVTGKKEVMALMTMREILERLPADRFARIHKSYIVAINKIDVIERDCVLIHRKEMPVGRNYRHHLLEMLHLS